MNISRDRLQLLLEQKRDSIGTPNFGTNLSANALGALSLVVSLTQFSSHGWVFITCLVFALCWIVFTAFRTLGQWRNRYDHKRLFSDIEALDMKGHPFDLMIIQNRDKNRVLTFFDKRWGMFLFPYKKMNVTNEGKQADKKELDYVTGYLAEFLQVPESSIHAEMSLRAFTEKYSVSDKVNKIYDHRFFKVSVDNLNEEEQFELAGTKFKWWTISDLEIDPDTKAHNSEIVATVKNEVL